MIEEYRALAHTLRGLPGEYELRPYTVTLVIVKRSGDYGLEGSVEEQRVPVVEGGGHPPRVRQLTDTEVAMGEPGAKFEVGPITPAFLGGGLEAGLLRGATAESGDQLYVELTGPDFAVPTRFRIVGGKKYDRPLGYTVRLAAVA